MANPYYVQALSGFNPANEIQSGIEQFKQGKQKEQLSALTIQASKGDVKAMTELWGANPEMAQLMEQREADKTAKMGALQAQQSKKAETDWGIRWKQSNTPEQKQALLQEAMANPLIDIDDDDVGIEGEQADLAVNTMLFGHLGKDGYKALLSADTGLGDLPSAVQETEWFNKQTPEIQETHLKIKRGEKPTLDQKLDYEKSKAEIKEDSAISTARKKTSQQRQQGYIDSGVSSADNLRAINSSLTLLEDIKTGGIDAAILKAKQLMGIESADEAELTYELGKSVLKQLKPTFGAAFTVNEMLELKRMEAGLGKSVAGNKRILKNLQRMTKRSAERGMRAARNLGEEFAANEIQLALSDEKTKREVSASNPDVPELSDEDILSKYGG